MAKGNYSGEMMSALKITGGIAEGFRARNILKTNVSYSFGSNFKALADLRPFAPKIPLRKRLNLWSMARIGALRFTHRFRMVLLASRAEGRHGFRKYKSRLTSMRLNIPYLSVLLLLVALAMPRTAQTAPDFPPHVSDGFRAAAADWLAGNDLPALQALGELSRAGDVDAQVLLGRIAERGALFQHVTAMMPRKDRVALLRGPGGLSGTSWLTIAAPDSALAMAFQDAANLDKKPAAASTLLRMGETDQALLTWQSLLFEGRADELINSFSEIPPYLFPPEAHPLLLQAAAMAGENTGSFEGSQRDRGMLIPDGVSVRLNWDWPRVKDILESDGARAILRDALPKTRSFEPIVKFCAQACPETATECALVATAAFRNGPFGLRSPVQSMIPDSVYWASPRITGDLVRSLPNMRAYAGTFDHIDACVVPALIAAQAEHGYAP